MTMWHVCLLRFCVTAINRASMTFPQLMLWLSANIQIMPIDMQTILIDELCPLNLVLVFHSYNW